MDFSFKRNAALTALILLLAAATQAVYTGFYAAEMTPPRQLLWGTEGFLFTMLAAFAGAALAQAKNLHVGWSAIVAAAVLNVVQVGVGLTMFGPFREVAEAVPEAAPAASGVVAFSFMVYNAAKVLLALAAIVFGLAKMNAGGKVLGGLTVFAGAIAFISNTVVMGVGLSASAIAGGYMPSGASGVVATVLLAVCLLTVRGEED